jgi:hypothetical protein
MVSAKDVENAQYYFGGLSCDCMNRLNVTVGDGEKVKFAWYAALALKPLNFTSEKKESLREMFISIQDEPYLGRSINSVVEMKKKFSLGKRNFGRDTLMSVNNICGTFVGLSKLAEITYKL